MKTGGILSELAKVPKSDGSAGFNSTAKSEINAEVDTALTDAALGTSSELAKVPKSDSTVTWNSTALASINAEVDTALNTAVPASPTVGSINDILSKASGGNTFSKATDSLEMLSDKVGAYAGTSGAGVAESVKAELDLIKAKTDTIVASTPSVLALPAATDANMGASTTVIDCLALAGYGNDYFNNKFYLGVLLNANSVGAAPEREWQRVTDYSSADGVFTTAAFSANVEANDSIIVMHESLIQYDIQEYTTGSGNWTVPLGWKEVEVLLVAGGGGGGADNSTNCACGGGGGECVFDSAYPVIGGATVAYSIGAGGAGATYTSGVTKGSPGGNTTFGILTAYGGQGANTTNDTDSNTSVGGNGGHYNPSGGDRQTAASLNPFTGGAGGKRSSVNDYFLFNGMCGTVVSCGTRIRCGGGGGGANINNSNVQWKGGDSIGIGGLRGAASQYAGGGGGGSWGAGANGGTQSAVGENAVDNSGGGGGGGGNNNRNGGAGGSGYIRIRRVR